MTEMTRAVMISVTTGAADLSILKYAHARVEETTDFGLAAFIRNLGCDFHNGAPLNLLWREDPELNPNNGFNFRGWVIKTCRHSVR
jgi:hypothetical protein